MLGSRPTRYLVFAALTVPTLILFAGVAIWLVTGQAISFAFFFAAFPFFGFIISVALGLVFPSVKELRIAAVINAIPISIVFFFAFLFWLVGYNG
jgi:hypothetical protein